MQRKPNNSSVPEKALQQKQGYSENSKSLSKHQEGAIFHFLMHSFQPRTTL